MSHRLQTPARELKDEELLEAVRRISAILTGASYKLYDVAIAMALEGEILNPGAQQFSMLRSSALVYRQKELPRIEADISLSWVDWASATNDNWHWLMQKYDALRQSYRYRFKKDPPWHIEVRRLWMRGPRPRPAGRTPFPEEPC